MTAVWKFVCAVEAVGKTPEGPRVQRTLMRFMTQTLRKTVGDERPAMIVCNVKLSTAFLSPIHVVRIRFAVDDWTIVSAVDRLAQEQNLEFEPIALREADGPVTYGIWGLCDGKPAIAMTATPTDDVLYVRIGTGFQPAIVLRDDTESWRLTDR
ncbi:MAG: hypothetical protein ACREEK_22675 [Bradyrhizobium sp.]